MFTKTMFLAGAAVGYVMGARAGHAQYEKIKSFAGQAEMPAPVANAAKAAAEKAQNLMGMGHSEQGQSEQGMSGSSSQSHIPSSSELRDSMPVTHL
jgi:hypothetical protein